MVWKTNVDAADYGDVLKTQKYATNVTGTLHNLVGQTILHLTLMIIVDVLTSLVYLPIQYI